MPPKPKFTKDEIAAAALNIVKEEGVEALTARNLGSRLGASARPIFTVFKSMEEVKWAARELALQEFERYFADFASYTPAFKHIGMQMVSYAIHEPELFKLLYMRDRSNESFDDKIYMKPLMEEVQKNLDLSEEDAYLFHLEMWIFVHGIAVMTATSYLEWDMDKVSEVLSDAYMGLKYRFSERTLSDNKPQ